MNAERLDQTDINILRAIQENARLTTKELALKVHLSTTPVFERLRRLEREGYIKKYIALLDANKLNRGFTVFCNVKLARVTINMSQSFSRFVVDLKEVTECYNISGNFDYMLKVQVPDMRTYRDFLLHTLGQFDNITTIESVFVMDEIKTDYGLQI